MPRIACLDLPALPLQLAERDHPEWRGRPVAVVDRDHPRGVVLWANERARRVGVLPGLRYAAGLSLDADLRAAMVPAEDIARAQRALTAMLLTLSPAVEPSPHVEEPGVFWLDADGLGLLHASLEAWAQAVQQRLIADRFRGAIAVGFSRFGSYATARALAGRGHDSTHVDSILWSEATVSGDAALPRRSGSAQRGVGIVVWLREDDERRAAMRVPLARVVLDPSARDALGKLGVATLGQLAALPEAGLLRRFGAEAHRLHQRARGVREEPITPARLLEPPRAHLDLDDPLADREALLFLGKQLLDPMLRELARRGQALAELRVTLTVDRAPAADEVLRPAAPTLDARMLLHLLRLRLERAPLAAGVRALTFTADGQPATPEQLALFREADAPRRDRAAGERALARLRAAFGDAAVSRARLRSGHLPEASFAWEPLERLVEPKPRPLAGLHPPLLRRVRTRALPLPARPTREPDGWLLRGTAHGPVARLTGPFYLAGGWWNRAVQRDYYYAELASGALCFIYYDRRRLAWYLHGELA